MFHIHSNSNNRIHTYPEPTQETIDMLMKMDFSEAELRVMARMIEEIGITDYHCPLDTLGMDWTKL